MLGDLRRCQRAGAHNDPKRCGRVTDTILFYAKSPVFTFRLGRIGLASTAIHSVDRSLFRNAARGATDMVLARLLTTIALDEDGRPSEPGRGRRPRTGGGT